MSFLGLFKSKQKKEMEKIQAKMFAQVFPNGNRQIEKEINEVNELLDSKYSEDQTREMYIHIAFLFFITEDKGEERIIGSSMIKTDNKFSRGDILEVYNYVKNKFLRQQLGIEDESTLDKVSGGIFGRNEGYDSDEIPDGYGDFGYSLTNPIPTRGIMGSRTYLEKLRSLHGNKEIKWEREGSCSSANIENLIDAYSLFNESGDCIKTIYISHYHKKNSDKAPCGFVLSQ